MNLLFRFPVVRGNMPEETLTENNITNPTAGGTPKIRIADLAARCGVSASTVSRALTGKGRISERVRARILAAAEEAGYTGVHHAAPADKPARTSRNIGVLIPRDLLYTSGFFNVCLAGISQTIDESGEDTMVILGGENDIAGLKRVVHENKVDGVIVTRAVLNDQCVAWLEKKGIPAIIIGSIDSVLPQIDINTIQASWELTNILLDMGCRRIAFIGGARNFTVNQLRYKGFAQAMQDRGIREIDGLVIQNLRTKTEVSMACKQVLELNAECIITSDDVFYSYVSDYLRDRHILVPQNIYLASCYLGAYNKALENLVTGIRVDAAKEGEQAAELMVHMLDGQKIAHETILSHSIQMGESTRKQTRKVF